MRFFGFMSFLVKKRTVDQSKARPPKDKIFSARRKSRLGRIRSTLGLAVQLDFEKRIFLIEKTSKPALMLALW